MSDKTIDDGGPAFPQDLQGRRGDNPEYQGMTLRDWFAGQALAGMLANPSEHRSLHFLTRAAVDYADSTIQTLKELPNAQ